MWCQNFEFLTLTNIVAKNVLLGDVIFQTLQQKNYFFQGEGSIICEGLSFDICSQVVGLSGDIGFLGLLQKKTCTFGGFNQISQNWGEMCCGLCRPDDFSYGSHIRFK